MKQALRGIRMGVALLGVCTTIAAFSSPPADGLVRELGRKIPVVRDGGSSGYAIADFDGDGMQDLALSGNIGDWPGITAIVKVFGTRQSDFGSKQDIVLDGEAPSSMLAWSEAGVARMLLIAPSGTVTVWRDWPLRQVRSFDVGPDTNGAAIGDVDADGRLDLLVVTDTTLSAFDLAAGAPEWSTADGGRDLIVEQLDADLPLEIVVAGWPGVVLDGTTRESDWSYIDGFGHRVAAGPIGPGGDAGFVAAMGGYFTVFQSAPWSPLWSFGGSQLHIDAVAVADFDGDGQAEIIANGLQSTSITVYDTLTHAPRTTIASPGFGGLRSVASLDLLGDGEPLVAFSPKQAGQPDIPVYLANATTGMIVSQLPTWRSGPYAAVAIGDFDGDGVVESAYGAAGAWANGNTATLTIVDARTGALQWQSPDGDGTIHAPFNFAPVVLLATGGQLVAAGVQGFSGQVLAVDGRSRTITWRVGGYSTGPMRNRDVADAKVWDVDGDSVADVIVGTEAGFSSASGVKLYAFSGIDGTLLWQSVAMGQATAECRGIIVGDTGYGNGAEMVAVLADGLRAFNVETKLLDWTLPVAADGASLISAGAAGVELAVFLGSTLSFHDGASHVLLRSFTLDGDITAVRALGDVRRLLVAAGGHLVIVDGADGTQLASSPYLGHGLAAHNQLAEVEFAPGSWLITAGSDAGLLRYRVDLSEEIFIDGFEAVP